MTKKAAKAPKAQQPSAQQPAAPRPALSAHEDAELTQAQLGALYDRLIEERERVRRGLGQHMNAATHDGDQLVDELDIAQRNTEQAYLLRFADKERKLLLEIENALEKMQNGEYGVCEGTGDPISHKRLELRPWTRYSVAHKEQLERDRSQHRR
ncbi:MAG: TraR/DksA family transcriptional regulator [Polyangiales bacterium]